MAPTSFVTGFWQVVVWHPFVHSSDARRPLFSPVICLSAECDSDCDVHVQLYNSAKLSRAQLKLLGFVQENNGSVQCTARN